MACPGRRVCEFGPDRPRQTRQSAVSDRRPQWRALKALCVTGAHRHAFVVLDGEVGRWLAADRRQGRAPAPLARQPARLRHRPLPPPPQAARHSVRGSAAKGSRATTGWAVIAGASSAPTPGLQGWTSCASALNAVSVSTWRCFRLLAPSFGDGCFLSFISGSYFRTR